MVWGGYSRFTAVYDLSGDHNGYRWRGSRIWMEMLVFLSWLWYVRVNDMLFQGVLT